ncbi:MAG: IgGFc-binding protein [Bacteroidetes bacterium]|nr:IgGFc-binding protein [Bacteroidota bacterium]MCL2301656.1 IgGFc-binding protein [Lentimicrobiaceae bacterium]
MKTIHYFLITTTLLISSIFSLQAQTTEGTKFWLTFGKNKDYVDPTHQPNFGIRIATGANPTVVHLNFIYLEETVVLNINPNVVYTYNLTLTQKNAIYNTIMGKTNYSLYITSNEHISVYVLDYSSNSSDATNVLPETSLGSEYYHISYPSYSWSEVVPMCDAYAVVAIKDKTNLYHNGTLEATLDMGEVYYKTSGDDMTGAHITANNPVAFFAVNQNANVPYIDNTSAGTRLMQQLAPVNTWDKTFFVPVTHFPKNIVRIVVSENNTNITQKGGIIRTDVPNAQTNLTNLQVGQFVELDIHLDSAGCYIQADKPVGVCTYMTNWNYSGVWSTSSPAQCWVPGINQRVSNVRIASLVPNFFHYLDTHHALVVTPTTTKNNTGVSIGDADPVPLFGGNWKDNAAAGMSFYTMPLTDHSASYLFSNQDGLIILGYGFCAEYVIQTYYYLAGSAMRDLDAYFTANDIHFQVLKDTLICEDLITFRAEIEGLHPTHPERIKWYIDGKEEEAERNKLEWSKSFSGGTYEIRMWVRYANDDTTSKTGTLIICNFESEFYVNNIHHQDLNDTTFCESNVVNFRAEIEGLHETDPERVKWYINGEEETTERNKLEWSKAFINGKYNIEMRVRYSNGETESLTGTFTVHVGGFIKMRNVRH